MQQHAHPVSNGASIPITTKYTQHSQHSQQFGQQQPRIIKQTAFETKPRVNAQISIVSASQLIRDHVSKDAAAAAHSSFLSQQNMMHKQNIDYQNQVIQLELQRAKQLSLQIKQMHENESKMSGSGGNVSHLSNSNASGSKGMDGFALGASRVGSAGKTDRVRMDSSNGYYSSSQNMYRGSSDNRARTANSQDGNQRVQQPLTSSLPSEFSPRFSTPSSRVQTNASVRPVTSDLIGDVDKSAPKDHKKLDINKYRKTSVEKTREKQDQRDQAILSSLQVLKHIRGY